MNKFIKWLEKFKWFKLMPPAPPKDLTEKEKEESAKEIIIRAMSRY